ncbi:MAG: 2OG-Fe(II) oxygenase [Blastocatellia bacterium]
MQNAHPHEGAGLPFARPRYINLPDPDQIADLAGEFASGDPFPHLVLRDRLNLSPEKLLPHFPSPEWDGWHRFTDQYQHHKLACAEPERIPLLPGMIIQEMSAPGFLRFIEQVTGIGKLIPDPYLKGGGLHCSGGNGVLAPHTDFHFYHDLGLFRRVNVLLYLTDNWDESCGGAFGLWRRKEEKPARLVVPAWGTMVIFRTDDQSVHGFATPVREGRWRRSIAMYYYTSEEAEAYSGDTTTYWRRHGELQGVRRLRLFAYRAALYGSRVFSIIAHYANPHVKG